MIVTGMVFGFWRGFAIIWCAMVLGAIISFGLGRYFLRQSFRDYIETSDYPKLRRMMRVAEDENHSFKFTFLFRFLFMPVWIRNYAPSMVNINFFHFLLSVMCHACMICTLFAATGAATKDMAEVYGEGGDKKQKIKP